MRHSVFPAAFLLFLSAGLLHAQELSRSEIAKQAKSAVVLVDAKPVYGSAFCVHSSGLFLTNNHVVERVPESGTVKLIVDASMASQKALTAKVIRRDKALDLALLSVADAHDLPVLALGDDTKIVELNELVAFGFPFGPALGRGNGEYPAVTVNVLNVSALRNDSKGELNRIQLDSSLSPGESGGPVVDRTGKVVGVVVGGIEGAGINLAIPVRHVRKFVDQPVFTFNAPTITPQNLHDPLDFQATASNLLSSGAIDLELELTAPGVAVRNLPMKLASGHYVVKTAAFPSAGEWCVPMQVAFVQGSVSGLAKDFNVKVGREEFKASALRRIKPGNKGTVELLDGKKIDGAVSLNTLTLRVGDQPLEIKLTGEVEILNASKPEDQRLTCVLIAKSAGKEIGRYSETVYVEGVRHDTLEDLAKGDFIKPLPTNAAVTRFSAVSTAGDFIGAGQSYQFGGNDIRVTGSAAHVTIQAGPWAVEVAPPRGQTLKVGDYPSAKRYPFNDDSPGLSITGNGRGSNQVGGRFVIWELVIENGTITRLAVDFIHRSEITGPPFYGMIRYNSTLE